MRDPRSMFYARPGCRVTEWGIEYQDRYVLDDGQRITSASIRVGWFVECHADVQHVALREAFVEAGGCPHCADAMQLGGDAERAGAAL